MSRSPSHLQLTTLSLVVECGSYTRAAELLDVTQPSVSQHIRELERACGAAVLRTHGRTLVPTPLGEQLARIGGELRKEMERASKAVADHASGAGGRVTIGASMTTAVVVVPNAIAAVRKHAPNATFAVKVGNSADIAQAVVDETVDVGVVEAPVRRDELVAETFAWDELVCVSARAPKSEIALAALAHETLLVREPGSGTREALEQALRETGTTFERRIEINDPQAIVASVRAGLGIAWMSERLARDESGLAIVQIAAFTVQRPFVRLYRRDAQPSTLARSFLEYAV